MSFKKFITWGLGPACAVVNSYYQRISSYVSHSFLFSKNFIVGCLRVRNEILSQLQPIACLSDPDFDQGIMFQNSFSSFLTASIYFSFYKAFSLNNSNDRILPKLWFMLGAGGIILNACTYAKILGVTENFGDCSGYTTGRDFYSNPINLNSSCPNPNFSKEFQELEPILARIILGLSISSLTGIFGLMMGCLNRLTTDIEPRPPAIEIPNPAVPAAPRNG